MVLAHRSATRNMTACAVLNWTVSTNRPRYSPRRASASMTTVRATASRVRSVPVIRNGSKEFRNECLPLLEEVHGHPRAALQQRQRLCEVLGNLFLGRPTG